MLRIQEVIAMIGAGKVLESIAYMKKNIIPTFKSKKEQEEIMKVCGMVTHSLDLIDG